MRHPRDEEERELLFDAFRAGWQAALAVKITNPRVLAVLESCFEAWLVEAADEVEVLGLPFRRRDDLPHLVRTRAPERAPVRKPASGPVEPAAPPVPATALEERPRGGALSAHPAS